MTAKTYEQKLADAIKEHPDLEYYLSSKDLDDCSLACQAEVARLEDLTFDEFHDRAVKVITESNLGEDHVNFYLP